MVTSYVRIRPQGYGSGHRATPRRSERLTEAGRKHAQRSLIHDVRSRLPFAVKAKTNWSHPRNL